MSDRRVKRLLNVLVAEKQLTRAGLDWLTIATDPFHDTEVSCEGYPDVTSSRTVVQLVTKTFNIKSPLSTDANWDAHIFLFPSSPNYDPGDGGSVLASAFYQASINPNGILGPSQLDRAPLYAGYNCVTCAAGVDWTTVTSNFGTAKELSWPLPFGAGQVRMIAAGYEVVNTTAEIYKQGTVTSYRSPSNESSGFILLTDVASERTYPIEWGTIPPTIQSDAALYPNSRIWAAEEGVYSIATMNSIQNPFRSPLPNWSGIIQINNEASLEAGDNRLVYVPGVEFTSGVISYVAEPLSHDIEFDVHGSIFSGLSAQTTLQITVRYYFERIPTISDENLLVLCKPSPTYDPLALEIYSRAVGQLPVACRVNENPLGEWFEGVMKAVSATLPTVGAAIGTVIPGAGAVGSALGGIAGLAGNANQAARLAAQTKVLRQETQALNTATNNLTKARNVRKQAPKGKMQQKGPGLKARPRKKT